jgi:hypothetical protein
MFQIIKKKTAHLKLKEFLVNLDSELLLEIKDLTTAKKAMHIHASLCFIQKRQVSALTHFATCTIHIRPAQRSRPPPFYAGIQINISLRSSCSLL